MVKYVIVGASAAAIGAVEAIREVDPVGSIAVISEEPCPQYSRPMISDFVSGKADFHKMKCRTDEFWKENNVEAFMGKKASALNVTEKTVQLEGGFPRPAEPFGRDVDRHHPRRSVGAGNYQYPVLQNS